MFRFLWDTFLHEPLINALAVLVSVLPGGDVGLAIIILTLIVKVILMPISHKSLESQAKMTKLAPELEQIKKVGGSKEEQARATFELYKKHGTNPFSGCLLMLVQIPIILALYLVFYKGVSFDAESLYSFVKMPEKVSLIFLGLIDLGGKSLVLAVIAGISQYLQARFMPKPIALSSDPNSFQHSFSKSMNLQMKYVFPLIVAVVGYGSGAIALYWTTSNIFTTIQQIYTNKNKTLYL